MLLLLLLPRVVAASDVVPFPVAVALVVAAATPTPAATATATVPAEAAEIVADTRSDDKWRTTTTRRIPTTTAAFSSIGQLIFRFIQTFVCRNCRAQAPATSSSSLV